MDPSAQKEIIWRLSALPPKTKKALDFLSRQSWLKKTKWYLAGGTALALQVGHRSSVDLDFFLPQNDFNIAALLKHFSRAPGWTVKVAKEGTIYAELLGAKISFIAYPFFAPKQASLWYGAARVLGPRDIATMKVIAISQRGRKRDFYDLYWCAKNLEPLADIVGRLDYQYPTVKHDYHHIIKSLAYFVDAENDPAPKIFFKASWLEVKKFFCQEAVYLSKNLVGLK